MNTDLDAANFELGRLVQLLDDERVAALWRPDALRREAIASLQLDSIGVDFDDLALGLLSPMLPAAGHRPVVQEALRIVRAAESMLAGRRATNETQDIEGDIGRDGDLLPADIEDAEGADDDDSGLDVDAVMAKARSSVTDIDSFLSTLRSGAAFDRAIDDPEAALPLLVPLSTPWLAAAWRLLVGVPDEDVVAAIAEATIIIDAGLSSAPGLMGAAAALHGLHANGLFPEPEAADYNGVVQLTQADREAIGDDDEALQQLLTERHGMRDVLQQRMAERRRAGQGWRFARLIAPWIIQRACGLSEPMPWISETLRHGGLGYASCATGPLPFWQRWLMRTLADGLVLERQRIIKLRNAERQHATWRGTRHADNRAGDVLAALWDRPAMGVKDVMRAGGYKTYRGAQRVIADLLDEGFIREVTERSVGRVWLLTATA